jgi:hypothetical protein
MEADAREWILVFLLTLVLETPVVMILTRKLGVSAGRRLALILFANLATHPLVWFFFPANHLNWVTQTVLAEIWAFGAEAIFYWLVFRPITFARATLLSVAANGVSLGIGLLFIRAG